MAPATAEGCPGEASNLWRRTIQMKNDTIRKLRQISESSPGELDSKAPARTSTPPLVMTVKVVIRCIFHEGLLPRGEADEYVELENIGNTAVNLDGLVLRDIDGRHPPFILPRYGLKPGQRGRVYTHEVRPKRGGLSLAPLVRTAPGSSNPPSRPQRAGSTST